MQRGSAYVMGCLLAFIGGTGLAGIEIDSDLLFWIYAIIFSVGVGLCLVGYEK